jgi:hypothetical protein
MTRIGDGTAGHGHETRKNKVACRLRSPNSRRQRDPCLFSWTARQPTAQPNCWEGDSRRRGPNDRQERGPQMQLKWVCPVISKHRFPQRRRFEYYHLGEATQTIMWSSPPSLHPHKLGLTLRPDPEAFFGHTHPSKPLGPRPEVWQFCSHSCVSPQILCTLENCRVPE